MTGPCRHNQSCPGYFARFLREPARKRARTGLARSPPPRVARADTTAALPFLLVFDGLSKQTSADWLLATPPGQTLGFLRLPRVLPSPVPVSGLSPWLVSLPSGASLARLAGLLWFAFRLAGGLVLGLVRLPGASVGLGLGVRGSDLRRMASLLFNTHIRPICFCCQSTFTAPFTRKVRGLAPASFFFSSRRGHV